MNKQKKSESQHGIGWCDYTWNPVTGCQHACEWDLPDGSRAECYAKSITERFGSNRHSLQKVFEQHYFHPDRLEEPLKLKAPARIFPDSMSDLMGHWVPDEQVQAVIDITRQAHWHTFQLLTKAAPRLLDFEFPTNVWLGVSAPPTFIMGRKLSAFQQTKMVLRQLDVLCELKGKNIRWMSIEPLSFDIAELFLNHRASEALDWIVIGAASNGPRIHQPKPEWLSNLTNWADLHHTPVFFKSNLKGNAGVDRWREDFPSGFSSP